jgi:SAM-dependent methyltransferase
MPNTNPLVARQYNEWVYPAPIEDLAVWTKNHCQHCDPSLHHAIIWPERAANPKLSILVAGCGTSQAAILAYTNPRASVVGIDISAASLAHAARLKSKHNLANLELHEMDLHAAFALNRKFDLIYATGVLHHLPDARSGLEALSWILEDKGVICAMLYAKYARAGIHMMQETLRRMGAEQDAEGITLVKQMIAALPPRHPAQAYIRGATRDLSSDAGIVDTFLHKEDHAFIVPEILAMADDRGLAFQGWTDNLDYYPDGVLAPDHPLFAKIAALPEPEQWAVIEFLFQPTGFHSFLLRKKNEDAREFRIDFNGDNFMRLIPQRRHLLEVKEEPNATILTRAGHTSRLEGCERNVFMAIDGAKNCGAIIAEQARGTNAENKARRVFARLWRLGHLAFKNARQ